MREIFLGGANDSLCKEVRKVQCAIFGTLVIHLHPMRYDLRPQHMLLFLLFSPFFFPSFGQPPPPLQVGAARTAEYFPLIEGTPLALVVNHTAYVAEQHLVDVLLSAGMHVKKIFAPEHGFLGKENAGQAIDHSLYRGIPVVSLYGAQKKMKDTHLDGIAYVLFDVQDVGVRFYTYLSTLHYVMEACARTGTSLLVLDRPNPNGDYVAGPILDPTLHSFVGLHPIPVVHGMTLGELAQMIKGEGWLVTDEVLALTVIKVLGWDHTLPYVPPIPPSPNLRSYHAIRWYPTLCLFEGTIMGVGRGTPMSFEAVGHPSPIYGDYVFTPVSTQGATAPRYEGKRCYGVSYAKRSPPKGLLLSELLYFYRVSDPANQARFFTSYFDKLCGQPQLRYQLRQGVPVEAIQDAWVGPLKTFLSLRENYLLYRDFE